MSGRRAIRRLSNAPPESAVVQDVTAEGQGVTSVGGKRVFVEGALTGEKVTMRRVRARSNYDEAELVAVAEASPDRTTPRCGYFGTCGGCSLQHMSRQAQLRLKEAVLLESLRRIGGVAPGRVLAATAGAEWGYRRRARLAARFVPGKDRVLVGFSERNSPRIADMRSCETLHPALSALLAPLSDLIGGLTLARRIPQVEAAAADNATALVFRVLDEPAAADLEALRAFRARHGVRILLQRGGPGGIEPLDPDADGGELWYETGPGGQRMTFGPTDFIQVNADMNTRMIDLALDLLKPQASARLLDLYCGIGNFTLPLAGRAGHVTGIEGDAAMTARARHNATLNRIANVEFRTADLAAEGAGATWGSTPFDGVLLDPPRAGAAPLMKSIADTGAARILYVSCHPGTLARDAGALVREHGYRLEAAGILDMFPATSHVESVALFEST